MENSDQKQLAKWEKLTTLEQLALRHQEKRSQEQLQQQTPAERPLGGDVKTRQRWQEQINAERQQREAKEHAKAKRLQQELDEDERRREGRSHQPRPSPHAFPVTLSNPVILSATSSSNPVTSSATNVSSVLWSVQVNETENIDPNILVTVSQTITLSMAAMIDKLSVALTKTMLTPQVCPTVGFFHHQITSSLMCPLRWRRRRWRRQVSFSSKLLHL